MDQDLLEANAGEVENGGAPGGNWFWKIIAFFSAFLMSFLSAFLMPFRAIFGFLFTAATAVKDRVHEYHAEGNISRLFYLFGTILAADIALYTVDLQMCPSPFITGYWWLWTLSVDLSFYGLGVYTFLAPILPLPDARVDWTLQFCHWCGLLALCSAFSCTVMALAARVHYVEHPIMGWVQFSLMHVGVFVSCLAIGVACFFSGGRV